MQRTAPAAKTQRAAPPQQEYRGPLSHQVGPLSATQPESAPHPRLTTPCTDQPERGGRASPTRRGPAALDRPDRRRALDRPDRRRPGRACDGLPLRPGSVHREHRQDREEHGPPVLQMPCARRRLQLLQVVRRGAARRRPQQPHSVLWRWWRRLRQRASQRLWRQRGLRCAGGRACHGLPVWAGPVLRAHGQDSQQHGAEGARPPSRDPRWPASPQELGHSA